MSTPDLSRLPDPHAIVLALVEAAVRQGMSFPDALILLADHADPAGLLELCGQLGVDVDKVAATDQPEEVEL